MLLLSRNYVFRVDPSNRDYSGPSERVRLVTCLPINLRLSHKRVPPLVYTHTNTNTNIHTHTHTHTNTNTHTHSNSHPTYNVCNTPITKQWSKEKTLSKKRKHDWIRTHIWNNDILLCGWFAKFSLTMKCRKPNLKWNPKHGLWFLIRILRLLHHKDGEKVHNCEGLPDAHYLNDSE